MKKRTNALVLAALSVGAFSVAAQPAPTGAAYKIPGGKEAEKKNKDGPGSIGLDEGLSLTPYLKLSLSRDNNLFLAENNTRSSSIALYNPGANLTAEGKASRFTFGADAKIARYAQSEADNYVDTKLFGVGEWALASNMGAKLAAEALRGHDPRGSNDRGISSAADEFRTNTLNGLYAYGGNDARGRIEVELGTVDKKYTNNRSTTAGSDRRTDNFAGRFFAKMAPKTSAVFEVRRDRLDYKLASSAQDGRETRLFGGLKWEATALTSGMFKAGRIQKDFDSAATADFSGFGWEGTVEWKPLSYSKVDLQTSKSFSESTGVGSFTLGKKYIAAWSHQWDSRLTSQMMLGRNSDEFVGNARRDETTMFGVKVNYKLHRALTLGGSIDRSRRDSNQTGLDYSKTIYAITLDASL